LKEEVKRFRHSRDFLRVADSKSNDTQLAEQQSEAMLPSTPSHAEFIASGFVV
jgi:hypothetical protein